MITDTLPPSTPPFRSRQRRIFSPIPRFNPRTVKFRAIRSRLPPLTSRTACARYRLGRREAVRHHALTKRLDSVNKHLRELHARLLHLLDSPILLPAPILASVIHDVEGASSLCRALGDVGHDHSLHGTLPSLSTSLHGHLKPATPCVPPSTLVDFFGG